MAKRYLGGGVSFEQKDVYQEFSEDEGGGGSSTLSGLTDVDISNPADGQTLVYNATSGKWENGAGGGAGAGVLLVNDVEGTLDKTWQEIHDSGIAILRVDNAYGYLCYTSADSAHEEYFVTFFTVAQNGTSFDDPLRYGSSAANGYPQWVD